MKKILLSILTISLLTILVACDNDTSDNNSDTTNKDNDDIVVRINDTEVKEEQYNAVYTQLEQQMDDTGQGVSDEDHLKDITMSVLVDQELIKQESEKLGIEISEDEIETEFENVKSQVGEDEFPTVLEDNKLTEETFKSQLSYELIREKYILSEFPDLVVSDEEMEEHYEQAKEVQGDEIPDFEDVKDQIKADLSQEKQGEAIEAKVQELEKKADIEKFI